MITNNKSIAISKNGKDYMRIMPFGSEKNRTEIKFSFFNDSFIIRKFAKSNEPDLLLYKPEDCGIASHELTYHNSNEFHSKPAILPKYKDNNKTRTPVFNEIIDLNLKNLIVPIPICRITVNTDSNRIYKRKKYHINIDLGSKYNTTEILISSAKYDYDTLKERFPNIVKILFPITTIDFLIYGAGMGVEPIMNKMFENKEPIIPLESNIIGNYRFYYRTYELVKTDAFRLYSKDEYLKNNFIEFFNNIEYLDLLATTNIGFKIKGTDRYDSKAAFRFDLEELERKGFHKDYIKRWKKRFTLKEKEYKKSRIIRTGILFK